MASKRIKAQYRGMVVWANGDKIDLSRTDMTLSEVEIIEKLKPQYVEQVKPKSKAEPKQTKPSSNKNEGRGAESGEDGDTDTTA